MKDKIDERLTIKNFSKIVGISTDNLRFFDKIGLLSPLNRRDNKYREYSFSQIADGHVITFLKKLSFKNDEIKMFLDNYITVENLEILKEKKIKIEKEIDEINKRKKELDEHIKFIEYLFFVKKNLDSPFVMEKSEGLDCVYVESEESNEIIVFFDKARKVIKNGFWMLKYNIGIIISASSVKKTGYSIKALYMFNENVKKMENVEFKQIPGNKYLCMYANGGLENNNKVDFLLKYARKNNYKVLEDIYIEEISGPGLEKSRDDFLILIKIPIEEKN